MEDRRVAALRSRVDTYLSTNNVDVLLSADATADAKRLIRSGRRDPAAHAVLASFYWYRYGSGAGTGDLAAAVDLSDQLRAANPDLRPPELSDVLDFIDRLVAGEDLVLDIDETDEERPAFAGLFYDLAGLWFANYLDTSDIGLLNRAIAAMHTTLELTPEEDPAYLPAMTLLGSYLSARGEREDLDAAVALLRQALERTGPVGEFRSHMHRALVGVLAKIREREDSANAVIAFTEAAIEGIEELGLDDPTGDQIAQLARADSVSALLESNVRDVDEPVALGRLAVAARAGNDPERPLALYGLALALQRRAGARRSAADNAEAIASLRQMHALSVNTEDVTLSALAQTMLSVLLEQRFGLTGDHAVVPGALAAAREAVEILPPGHSIEAFSLTNLGSALSFSYGQTGARDDLDEAIETLQRASHTGEARTLSILGAAYYTRYLLSGVRADLDDSVRLTREAVTQTSADDEGAADWLENLGTALRLRYEETGSSADIDEAVRWLREAAERTPAEHADRARACASLGGALLDRYRRTNSAADLDEAVRAMRDAVAPSGPESSGGAILRSSLGVALTFRYEQMGFAADLDEAVELLHTAVSEIAAGSPERALILNNFGSSLQFRFELTGSRIDLDQAVAAYREAIEAVPADSPQRTMARGNLGSVLESRFQLTGDRADLDEAIGVLRAAESAAASGSTDRPVIATNLGKALFSRYEDFSELADLDGAIDAARAAMESIPATHFRQARYRSQLGALTLVRAERQGEQADLDAAVTLARAAVDAMAPGDPQTALYLANLGNALLVRSRSAGSATDRVEALRALRSAAQAETSPARVRVRAARRWGSLAAEDGNFDEALAGLEAAVHLLPLLAWRGIPRADQERFLSEMTGLASDAAAVAITVGRTALAVELLEQGRTVLWSQLLDTRTDLTELRSARPDLADRLTEVGAALELHADRDFAGLEALAETDRTPLAREWDELITEVRRLAGFEGFLRPRRFEELAQVAIDGPVVIVNVSGLRCDALVITSGDVHTVQLPGLTAHELGDYVNDVLTTFSQPLASLPRIVAMHQTITRMLEWLWPAVTGPVLNAIGSAERIWWCPTGQLALLPLHAAIDPASGEPALDKILSSYTPTLRALITARSRASLTHPNLLIVALPETPGAPDLDVQPETETLTRLFGQQCKILTGVGATVSAVRNELASHHWVHFACHGQQDLLQPSQGALLLHDGPLTVLEVARQRHINAELAFLSACQTAVGGALPDEAIHLAASLQVTGFRHVIATLWPIHDALAPQVTNDVYTGLAAGRDVSAIGDLLHQAVRRLRNAGNVTMPALWAPYIHIGP
ncbi:MAG TPA: CHAT domain-containing protein [Streptosporangiaceae bacterium]|nr:CHAT domain-containing protein [Streptosporangiaceae bacterium]